MSEFNRFILQLEMEEQIKLFNQFSAMLESQRERISY
jgi:hypothetical protein